MAAETTLDALPLSALLRESTRAQHEHAETRGFITQLMEGRLSRGAYADLAVQHRAIYAALESAGDRVALDPVGARLVFGELLRSPSLAADVDRLADAVSVGVLPATRRYAGHLIEHASAWPGTYLAHAYTRYLGDLAGGQAVRAMVQRHYGVPDDEVTFYEFAGIRVKPFKDAYRAAMDAAPFSEAERQRIAAEAQLAFTFNSDVFNELGAIHAR